MQIVDVGRDQKLTELALKSLDDVVRGFPDGKYARDAKLKLDFTRDHLAGKEMEIGRYYLKRDEYLAAINRFKRVIDNYQTTTHVPEALERLVECGLALGLDKEAKANAAGLGDNNPRRRLEHAAPVPFPRGGSLMWHSDRRFARPASI